MNDYSFFSAPQLKRDPLGSSSASRKDHLNISRQRRVIWVVSLLLTGLIAITLEVLGSAEVGSFRATLSTVYLYPGLIAVFVSNGFNPHVDLTGADDVLIVFVTAAAWSSLVVLFSVGLSWIAQRFRPAVNDASRPGSPAA